MYFKYVGQTHLHMYYVGQINLHMYFKYVG